MEANELRLGNFINFEQTTHVVSGIVNKTIYSFWLKDIEKKDLYSAVIYDYKPLPITEEWKEKLKDTPLFMDKIGFVIFKNGYTYSFIWEDYPFVHQLQNLYFALTGEELTLNT